MEPGGMQGGDRDNFRASDAWCRFAPPSHWMASAELEPYLSDPMMFVLHRFALRSPIPPPPFCIVSLTLTPPPNPLRY